MEASKIIKLLLANTSGFHFQPPTLLLLCVCPTPDNTSSQLHENPHFISSSLCSSLLSSLTQLASQSSFLWMIFRSLPLVFGPLHAVGYVVSCAIQKKRKEEIDNCEHRTHHHQQEAGGIWAQLESFFFIN